MAVKAGQGRKKPPGTNEEGGEGEGEGEGDEQFVTQEQLNAAVTKAITRFGSKTLPKLLETQLTGVLAKAGFKPQAEEGEEGEEGGEGEGEGAEKTPAAGQERPKKAPAQVAPAGPTPEQKKLARLQREMDDLKKEREETARKAAADEERNTLKEQLTSAGVRKEMIGPLAAWMLGEDSGKMVRRNSEGRIVFLQGSGDEADEVPIKDGLAGWLKTDEGKAHLAPRPVGGSGFQMPGQNRGAAPSGARPGSAAAVAQNNASADDDLYSAVMGVVQGGNPLS
jgi:hypothetical protein